MPRVRKDIRHLTEAEEEKLLFAFRWIQTLSHDHPDSFYNIAGLHGQPFRGAGYTNKDYWGGFCQHGNVLFPTWHRAYLLRLEEALQNAPGCRDVALPYWNELQDDENGKCIPKIFTDKTRKINGEVVPNPLFSYTMQQGFFDNLARDVPVQDDPGKVYRVDYSKPRGYQTVRYPYSGLVGPSEREKTKEHNAEINKMTEAEINQLLQDNVKSWLVPDVQGVNLGPPVDNVETEKSRSVLSSLVSGYNQGIKATEEGDIPVRAQLSAWVLPGTREQYLRTLLAPNYTVFSNTTSAAKWNDDNFGRPDGDAPAPRGLVVPLEKPHNAIHLAVGGYDLPNWTAGKPKRKGANGDMGENDTAAFDPIFYFHHCFIDLVFWSWQKLNNATDTLDIIEYYPGTNSVDEQGPTPGVYAGAWLTADSPIDPFKDGNGNAYTTKTLADIHELGYDYDQVLKPYDLTPSELLGQAPAQEQPIQPAKTTILRISGVSRKSVAGSFVVSLWGRPQGAESDPWVLFGVEPVFSRWHVSGCANCQNSLAVKAHFPVTFLPADLATDKLVYTANVESIDPNEEEGRKGHPLVGVRPSVPSSRSGIRVDVGEYLY